MFADLGYPDADERQTKLRLAHAINGVIARRRLTQAAAGKLGVNQPKVSALADYKLDGFSVERLMTFLTALDQDVEMVIKKKPSIRSYFGRSGLEAPSLMPAHRLEFGYHPGPLRLQAGPVTVEPLLDPAQTVAAMAASEGVEKGWIYAPPQQEHNFDGDVRTLPYASRVFGLPKTHVIEHATPDSDDHLTFHLWVLSFFTGMRLTATEAGFVDATPLKPGALVDFVPLGKSQEKAVDMAEVFWAANRAEPQRARLFAAAVHALFLRRNPRYVQFEQFMLLYTVFDACFALAKSMQPPKHRITHVERVAWMCGLFSMATAARADPAAPGGPEVANLRNATIHEALFVGEPLGFALHGAGTNQNLMSEMKGLICRLLVALLGGAHADYVRSSLNTRQTHGLNLS